MAAGLDLDRAFLKYVVAAVFAILAVYIYLKWRKRTKVHSRQ